MNLKCAFVSLFILMFSIKSMAQTHANIADVDFHLEDRYIVINYLLSGALPEEQLNITLKFYNEKNEEIVPKTVTGDVGTKIFTNGKKEILWDILTDQFSFSGNLKASLTIVNTKILYNGPSNAFLSILIPGLGGYKVDKNKTRSIFTTVGTLGLIGYGITQKIYANRLYSDYNDSNDYTQIQSIYDKANAAHHRYYISTRVAAGIWALDILYVAVKGFYNKNKASKAYKSPREDLQFSMNKSAVQFKLTLDF